MVTSPVLPVLWVLWVPRQVLLPVLLLNQGQPAASVQALEREALAATAHLEQEALGSPVLLSHQDSDCTVR
jgi:hypothetical protein